MLSRIRAFGGHSLSRMRSHGLLSTAAVLLWICLSCWVSNKFTMISMDFCHHFRTNRMNWNVSTVTWDIHLSLDLPSSSGSPIWWGKHSAISYLIWSQKWNEIIFSIDRLLLALLWTTYMFVAWRTDKQDLAYHRGQYDRKKAELHIKWFDDIWTANVFHHIFLLHFVRHFILSDFLGINSIKISLMFTITVDNLFLKLKNARIERRSLEWWSFGVPSLFQHINLLQLIWCWLSFHLLLFVPSNSL